MPTKDHRQNRRRKQERFQMTSRTPLTPRESTHTISGRIEPSGRRSRTGPTCLPSRGDDDAAYTHRRTHCYTWEKEDDPPTLGVTNCRVMNGPRVSYVSEAIRTAPNRSFVTRVCASALSNNGPRGERGRSLSKRMLPPSMKRSGAFSRGP